MSSATPSWTTTRAPESSIWNAASPAVRLGLIGVRAAPIRQAANMTTTSSTRLVSIVATTSPGPTPGGAQHRRGGLDACEELGVGEGEPIVVDARRGRVERSALVGQGGQRRREDHAEQPTDGGRWWLRAAATSLGGSFVRANRGMWRFARTPVRRAPSGAGARRRARSRVRRWGSAGRGGGR